MDVLVDDRHLLLAVHADEPHEPVKDRERHVVPERVREKQPLELPVFRHKAYAVAYGVGRVGDFDGSPVQQQLAMFAPVDPEDRARELAAPRSDQPREAQHLATAE